MWYIILSAIILICLYVIYRVAGRKIGQAKRAEREHVAQDKQAQVKKQLLQSKLEKKFINWGRSLVGLFGLGWSKLAGWKGRIKKESKREMRFGRYRPLKAPREIKGMEGEAVLAGLLLEAQVLLKKRKIDEAESKFIEVLEIQPKNIEAYMGLGEIYGIRGDWQTAEEAYRYIIKIDNKFFEGYRRLVDLLRSAKKWAELKVLAGEILELGHEEAWVLSALGMAHKKTGYPDKAEEYFKRAVEAEPQNEELLDYLLEVAIINKNQGLAKKALNTLSGISRDEIKLQGYRDKIDIL